MGWVGALTAFPGLVWSGGNKVMVSQIAAYVAELTPGFLTADTKVINHGYKNGKATPRPAVLQKGTAVLFDSNGVPRARCKCGNPLGDNGHGDPTTTTSSTTTTSGVTTLRSTSTTTPDDTTTTSTTERPTTTITDTTTIKVAPTTSPSPAEPRR